MANILYETSKRPIPKTGFQTKIQAVILTVNATHKWQLTPQWAHKTVLR